MSSSTAKSDGPVGCVKWIVVTAIALLAAGGGAYAWYQIINPPSPPIVTTSTTKPDSDSDGLGDEEETANCTDPFDPDTDDDGILDGKDPEPNRNMISYSIAISTGNVNHASLVDQRAFIRLYGNLCGKTLQGMVYLLSRDNYLSVPDPDPFVAGDTNFFMIDMLYLGELARLDIWLGEPSEEWYLDKVIVSDSSDKTWEFPCDGWLSSKNDFPYDGQYRRTLFPIPTSGCQ